MSEHSCSALQPESACIQLKGAERGPRSDRPMRDQSCGSTAPPIASVVPYSCVRMYVRLHMRFCGVGVGVSVCEHMCV